MRAPIPPDLLQDLRDRIRGIEGVRDRGPTDAGPSTGFPNLDRALGGGGLRAGSLVEWRGTGDGSGAFTLALAVAAHRVREDGALVVLDDGRDFYPVAAAGLGVPLDRSVVVRASDPAGSLWAWEQALRAPAVAVTVGLMTEVPDQVARRLQLAAEAGGGLGFLIRPPDARGSTTWAATRVEVAGVGGGVPGAGWRLRVRVTRGQAGARGSAELELGHDASPVPLVPELAGPVANRRRRARR
jgi:protein ImuA